MNPAVLLRPEIIVFALAVAMILNVGGCRASSDLPGNRHFGTILNNDATNIMYAGTGEDMTPDEYRNGVHRLLDAKPGVLAQSIGQPDPVFYRSKVATRWDKYWGYIDPETGDEMGVHATNIAAPAVRALAAQGTDPLALTVEVCRQRGVSIVASFRMNGEDMATRTLHTYDFGRENMDLRIPGRHCLDPAHPKVYEHRMKIFREVVENYDIDGIEFDYKRTHYMISNPRKNHVILTRMVRETRQMLDEVAKRKGRKRLLLGVRVEPMIAGTLNKADLPGALGPPYNRSCEASGLDIQTWIDEELVDYVCPSLFWPKWPGLPRTAEFVELAKGKNVGIYPTVFPQPAWWDDKDGPLEVDDTERMRRYKNDLCDMILSCYRDGADGISTFNWLPHHQRGMQPDPNRPNWGDGHKGMQMKIHPLLADLAALEAYRVSPVLLD